MMQVEVKVKVEIQNLTFFTSTCEQSERMPLPELRKVET